MEMTPDGKKLDKLIKHFESGGDPSYGREPEIHAQAIYCGTALSKSYASSVKGDAATFCIGSQRDSAFRQFELPSLMKNSRLNAINGIDAKSLQAIYRSAPNGPEACFTRICQAELERDRAHAMEPGIDYEHRKGLLQTELGAHQLPRAGATLVRTATGASALNMPAENAHRAGVSHGRVIQGNADRAPQVSQPLSRTGKAWAEIQTQKQGVSGRQAGEHTVQKDDLQQVHRHLAGKDRKR